MATSQALYYLAADAIYLIEQDHLTVGHNGCDTLQKHVASTLNITTEMINLFLTICKVLNSMKEKKQELLSSSITY
jgi:hypothetical protein